MAESGPRRKLAAILAADVVGFSKMMGENEDRTLRNLKACRSLTDEAIKLNHGRNFWSAGDSVIAEFAESSRRSGSCYRVSEESKRSQRRCFR